MQIKYVTYNRKYFYQCARLMDGTWDFLKYFKGIKDKDIVYGAFFEGSLISSTYTDIIVDKNENVLGYLIGSSRKQVTFWRKSIQILVETKFYLKQFKYLLLGKYGDKKTAFEQFKSMMALTNCLERDKKLFDGEVNLFFISPLLRGQGYGKKLMDRFVEYCQLNKINKIFLWTDRGCNFKFYEHYGFELYDQINHQLLAEPEEEYNGFVYSMTLK
ncbi:MAG: GNAT family N-acetyltransferase [Clostridia bacterium]|nr:GNAT family N-acetyltransferase [Clostridia bacterium]